MTEWVKIKSNEHWERAYEAVQAGYEGRADTVHGPMMFDMEEYGKVHACGTSCCIAGAVLFTHSEVKIEKSKRHVTFILWDERLVDWVDIAPRSADLLGLGPKAAAKLFDPINDEAKVLEFVKHVVDGTAYAREEPRVTRGGRHYTIVQFGVEESGHIHEVQFVL